MTNTTKMKKVKAKVEDVQIIKEELMSEEPTIVVDEDIEVEVEITPDVTIEKSEIIKPSKLVRIRVKEKFKCFIGEWYYFEKNKIYSVPEHVKNTLMKRDKLLPM